MARDPLESTDSLPIIGDALSPVTTGITFAAGARVFDEADSGNDAYLIESGYVEIARGSGSERKVLAVLGPGEVFGEMAAIEGVVRSASATAVHQSVLIPITAEQIEEALNSANPLTQLMMRTAINRLRLAQRTSLEQSGSEEQADSAAVAAYKRSRVAAAHYVRLASELRTALENRHFELHFQPILTLADGRPAGAEVLLRWQHPERGAVSPGEFIPAAENTGLIVPIGAWVLEHSITCLARMQREHPEMFISVNVSPRQLESEQSVERLARTIERSAVDPTTVKLEITEQALHDPAVAMAALARLRTTGASISIDDFGTGYSSLNYLSRYPVDSLKIDRTFVGSIAADERGQRVVSAILGIARELDMEVVAEGIEADAQFRWLQDQGCNYGQGFLMARPLPYADALDAMRQSYRWE